MDTIDVDALVNNIINKQTQSYSDDDWQDYLRQKQEHAEAELEYRKQRDAERDAERRRKEEEREAERRRKEEERKQERERRRQERLEELKNQKVNRYMRPPRDGTNEGINAEYIRTTMAMWDWNQPDMQDAEAVDARVMEYYKLCIETDSKPSAEGLAFAFGVSRSCFKNWIAPGSHAGNISPESRAILAKAYNVLNIQLADYMMNGNIHPVSGIFLMKNNYAYEDRTEVQHTVPNMLGEQKSAEELRQKYLANVDNVGDADYKEKE